MLFLHLFSFFLNEEEVLFSKAKKILFQIEN